MKDETCGIYQEKKNAYKILVGKPEVKRPPARIRSRWENDIETVLTQTEWETRTGVKDKKQRCPHEKKVKNLQVSQNVGNFLNS